MATLNKKLNTKWNCRLTTVGRKTGRPRTVTLWFVLDGETAYLAGGKAEPLWCKNIRAHSAVTLEIAGQTLHGHARVVESPEEGIAIRQRFADKYWLARLSRLFGGYRESVPVVVNLAP